MPRRVKCSRRPAYGVRVDAGQLRTGSEIPLGHRADLAVMQELVDARSAPQLHVVRGGRGQHVERIDDHLVEELVGRHRGEERGSNDAQASPESGRADPEGEQ